MLKNSQYLINQAQPLPSAKKDLGSPCQFFLNKRIVSHANRITQQNYFFIANFFRFLISDTLIR